MYCLFYIVHIIRLSCIVCFILYTLFGCHALFVLYSTHYSVVMYCLFYIVHIIRLSCIVCSVFTIESVGCIGIVLFIMTQKKERYTVSLSPKVDD